MSARSHGRVQDRRRASELRVRGGDFLVFALTWAPYGGPSSEEIFVRFGMTRARFTRLLWQIVEHNRLEPEVTDRLKGAYPLPATQTPQTVR